MSETLWAAVIGGAIGGLIAIAATIPPLIYRHYHWKKEKKLEYLITERNRRKEQYKYLASKIPEAIEKNLRGDEILAELSIDLPNKVRNKIFSLVKEMPNNVPNGEKVDTSDLSFQMTESMKESLDEMDKEIKELMS